MVNTKSSNSPKMTYADAGVDIAAGNALVEAIKPLVKGTKRTGVMGNVGGFGGLFDLQACGYVDPVLVAANDGVGTKLKLAFETGRHDTVGIDLVAMCVNDLVVQGAEPLFFLDYFATGKLESDVAINVIEGVAEGCRQAGCALIGGETAEMPGMYGSGEYDLAGFAVGAVERNAMLPSQQLSDGDMLIGLASSGVHSNGFSLVRHIVERHTLDWSAPAPFAPEKSLGEAFLQPTIIYVKSLLKAIQDTGAIKALAHITGGGLTENIPRILTSRLDAHIDLGALPHDGIFKWLAQRGGITAREMLKTFNCGVGMVVICDRDHAEGLLQNLEQNGETAFVLGHLSAGQSDGAPSVVYSGKLGYSKQ